VIARHSCSTTVASARV
ncbi:hypothetical protein ECPA45_4876, partial [Escherichia coli PA45]